MCERVSEREREIDRDRERERERERDRMCVCDCATRFQDRRRGLNANFLVEVPTERG